MEMNDERYLTLLAKLIGEAENLQNNPQQGLVPQENLAANHVLALLEPHSKEKGKFLGVIRLALISPHDPARLGARHAACIPTWSWL